MFQPAIHPSFYYFVGRENTANRGKRKEDINKQHITQKRDQIAS
jgi:hypothetical protein